VPFIGVTRKSWLSLADEDNHSLLRFISPDQFIIYFLGLLID
jgi:hypothetical protein